MKHFDLASKQDGGLLPSLKPVRLMNDRINKLRWWEEGRRDGYPVFSAHFGRIGRDNQGPALLAKFVRLKRRDKSKMIIVFRNGVTFIGKKVDLTV